MLTKPDAFIRDELSKGRYDPAITKICFEILLELFGRTLKLDLGSHDGVAQEIENICWTNSPNNCLAQMMHSSVPIFRNQFRSESVGITVHSSILHDCTHASRSIAKRKKTKYSTQMFDRRSFSHQDFAINLSGRFCLWFGISPPFSSTPDSQGRFPYLMFSKSSEQVLFHGFLSSNISLCI